MFGLPLEIIGPVIGFGAIISFITAGIVVVRRLAPANRGRGLEDQERQMLEDLQSRLGELDDLKHRVVELEERVDFSERLLARPPDRK
ncbi:MAG TPA: hypothetical protein VFU23_00490 [Gemmatimonadales bacterium]|nr:hypothetical protein [Gemmatimonadales bacterium]